MKDFEQKTPDLRLAEGQQSGLYDPLTGLPARLLLEERLRHTLERCAREGSQAAVLIISLDEFSKVNDSFGRKAGDALLIAVAERLGKVLRQQDTLAHLGGNKFVLALEALHEYPGAEIMAGRVQAVLLPPFPLPEGYSVYARASIGISVYSQDGDTAQDLLTRADTAVRRAKELGGNQFFYYTSELNVQARATLELEQALRQALLHNEFVLYYQPKVDLRSGRIVGAEALVRWQRPGFGLVPPLDFIPAAEKNGLIVPIGAWVIEEACRQMRAWRDAGLAEIRVAVNVSALQFRGSGLEEKIIETLERYAVEPGQLMLELTESMLMANPEDAVTRMLALKRLGIHLSLDDFGTGYASLAYLGRFPIDQMKIDRSFVTDIVTDPGAATIAAAIIALAQRMRISVIAEGVETEAQLGYLRQNGCEEIQGYFFSRPVSADDFAAMLKQGKKLAVADEFMDGRALLIVDDEPDMLSTLRRILADEGYRVFTAESAAKGLELLAKHPAQVIISDQRMNMMSGTEFLGRVKALYPDTVRLILSGYVEVETVMQAVNEGAVYRFLNKPIDAAQLKAHLKDAFRHYETSVRRRVELDQEHIELKRLFAKVKRAKDEWVLAMDTVADLVVLVDAAGMVYRCNKAVCDFLAKSYAEIIGQSWEELGRSAELYQSQAEQEGLPPNELSHTASRRFFQEACYFNEVSSGEWLRIITLHDISERKRIMEIIAKKNDELQSAYDALKATHSQLVQQEKMASIGQLAAGVAHEINNPIGFVTSNLGSLQKYLTRMTEFLRKQAELFPLEAGDDRTRQLAELGRQLKIEAILDDLPSLVAESLDGVDRVRTIVQNLKSFSRIDQSDYSLADINRCLDDTLNIIWNELKYKCTVKKDYGDLPHIRCYPQQLNQVFMNLLVNAAQAIEGQGEIVITTRASETEVTIAIADSGAGISAENLNRIFEPFFTTKEVGKGTGLGLSITYDLVTKKHGGKIEVVSELGKGTTFVVTLPIKAE